LTDLPCPGDKDSWFPEWILSNDGTTYIILSHLPTIIHPTDVHVEISPQHESIQYDSSTTTITYTACDEFVQFAVRVHVNADSFKLHDVFFAWNDVEPDYQGMPPSWFQFQPQVHIDLPWGPFLGTTVCAAGKVQKSRSKRKQVDQSEAETDAKGDGTNMAQEAGASTGPEEVYLS
jgi:hypothetical protein